MSAAHGVAGSPCRFGLAGVLPIWFEGSLYGAPYGQPYLVSSGFVGVHAIPDCFVNFQAGFAFCGCDVSKIVILTATNSGPGLQLLAHLTLPRLAVMAGIEFPDNENGNRRRLGERPPCCRSETFVL